MRCLHKSGMYDLVTESIKPWIPWLSIRSKFLKLWSGILAFFFAVFEPVAKHVD